MMIGFWIAAIGASQIPNIDGDDLTLIASPDLNLWVAVLLIQSIPYAAAVFLSFVNALGLSGRWIGESGHARTFGNPAPSAEADRSPELEVALAKPRD